MGCDLAQAEASLQQARPLELGGQISIPQLKPGGCFKVFKRPADLPGLIGQAPAMLRIRHAGQ